MKRLLILALCLLMTACADEYIIIEATTVTPEKEPFKEVQVEVKEEPEIYELSHFIEFDPANVTSVTVQMFHSGPSVVEQEAVIQGVDAQNFAKKLADIKVTDYDPYAGGQGMSTTRYSLQLIDGTSFCFCDDGSIFIDDSNIPSQRTASEFLCSRTDAEEIGFALGQTYTWYDYIDDVRTPRLQQGQLGDYLGIQSERVVKLIKQDYLALEGGGFVEEIYTLEGEEAAAAAAILDNTTVFDSNFSYEQMGLARCSRYTLLCSDGFEESFCESGAIFLSGQIPPYADENADFLCTLGKSQEINLPFPEEHETFYHIGGKKLTPQEFEKIPALASLVEIPKENITSLSLHRFCGDEETVWQLSADDAVRVADYLKNRVKVCEKPVNPIRDDLLHSAYTGCIFRYVFTYADGTILSLCVSDTVFCDDSDIPSAENESAEVLGYVFFDPGFVIPYDAEEMNYHWVNGQRIYRK